MKYHCVQCHKHLKYTIDEEKLDHVIWVCHYPDCPNYGLLQLGIEGMTKEKEDEQTLE